MLEAGAFHPSWGDIHLGPKNALEALALLGGGAFLPVHWSMAQGAAISAGLSSLRA
jgi:hypothetical protein